MTEWINSDGLRVRFGTDEATVTRGGEVRPYGEDLEIVFKISLTQAAASSALIPNTTGIFLPAGLRIDEVIVKTDTAATSGGSAVLNVGLNRLDTTTAIDADGLLAAIALTSHDAAGETTVYRVGTSGAGALIGTTLSNPGVLVFDYDTAAYTAGVLTVIVHGRVPWPSVTN